MKEYSLGFIFNENLDKVLLINKLRPADQAGLYNGIGGKKEYDDLSIEHCFIREVKEEADIDLTLQSIHNIGSFGDNQNYKIGIFTCSIHEDIFNSFTSLTDEKVEAFYIHDIENLKFSQNARDLLYSCLSFYRKV